MAHNIETFLNDKILLQRFFDLKYFLELMVYLAIFEGISHNQKLWHSLD